MTFTNTQPPSSVQRAIYTIVGVIFGFVPGFGAVTMLSIAPGFVATSLALGIPVIGGCLGYWYGAAIHRKIDASGFIESND